MNIPLSERIIFALDFPDTREARHWVERLSNKIKFYKVGLELFLGGCWDMIDFILDKDCKVMLDLKLFDIPQTVGKAVRQLHGRGISLTTIHGNDAIIEAACREKGDELKVLAVTVLTSFDDRDIKELGLDCTVDDLVVARAKKAVDMGCDGIVASAREVKRLRKTIGENAVIVTPGIRPSSSTSKDDQKRIATPYEAVRDGADHMVIGRPISMADNPEAVVDEILSEIQIALDHKDIKQQ